MKRKLKKAIRAFKADDMQFEFTTLRPPQITRISESGLLRPCEVDGKPCLFHRWIDEDKAVLEIGMLVKQETLDAWRYAFNESGAVPPASTVKILRHTYALVEYPDGSVGKVEPELVRFLDRKEY